jgi:hypothetical protein
MSAAPGIWSPEIATTCSRGQSWNFSPATPRTDDLGLSIEEFNTRSVAT